MRRCALALAALLLGGCAGSAAQPRAQRAGAPPERIAFAELDANGDARIDGEEFALLSRRLFTRLDADGDGNLSAEEYARFMQRPDGPPRGRGPLGPGGPGGRPGEPPWGGS